MVFVSVDSKLQSPLWIRSVFVFEVTFSKAGVWSALARNNMVTQLLWKSLAGMMRGLCFDSDSRKQRTLGNEL